LPDGRKIDPILEHHGVPDEFVEIAATHAARAGTRVRLSQPGSWGIASNLVDDDCVLTNTYYGYCLYCAEVSAKRDGREVNDLAAESDTVVVALFGKDNAGIGLIAPYVIGLASDRFRPFDYVVVNHLLHFEGSKCSKSRRHGIWVGELLENSSVTGDELRYALARTPLEATVADISVSEIVDAINKLRDWRSERLNVACWRAGAEPNDSVIETVIGAVRSQARALRPDSVRMPTALSALNDWMFDRSFPSSDPSTARAWTVGVALLAEPIMPRLAQEIWEQLGLRGSPTLCGAGTVAAPASPSWQRRLPPLSSTEIRSLAHISTQAV
jgi:methionyl-tRNA synthetase